MSKCYIAKKDTWFKEGTKCRLLKDYQECGLYRGIYIVCENKGYDTFWYNKGYKEGDEVVMNEVCLHDEFVGQINNIDNSEYKKSLNGCDNCVYMIEYLDEDKWGEVCGECGKSKKELIEIEKLYWKEYNDQL